MKPGCCFMKAASEAQASWSCSASSGSTVKVLIRTTEPTCCSICSKSDTCLSISTSLGIYPPSLGVGLLIHTHHTHDATGRVATHSLRLYSPNIVEGGFSEVRLPHTRGLLGWHTTSRPEHVP